MVSRPRDFRRLLHASNAGRTILCAERASAAGLGATRAAAWGPGIDGERDSPQSDRHASLSKRNAAMSSPAVRQRRGKCTIRNGTGLARPQTRDLRTFEFGAVISGAAACAPATPIDYH